MSYQVTLTRRAQRQLNAIAEPHHARIEARMADLGDNPRPHGCLKLTGQPFWRIRVGHYRVVYEIHDEQLLVAVIEVGHRRDVYR